MSSLKPVMVLFPMDIQTQARHMSVSVISPHLQQDGSNCVLHSSFKMWTSYRLPHLDKTPHKIHIKYTLPITGTPLLKKQQANKQILCVCVCVCVDASDSLTPFLQAVPRLFLSISVVSDICLEIEKIKYPKTVWISLKAESKILFILLRVLSQQDEGRSGASVNITDTSESKGQRWQGYASVYC